MNDLTIMYSGGLDSLIAYNYAKYKGYNPLCLWVNMDHEYANKEKQAMYSVLDMAEKDQKLKKYVPKIENLSIQGLIPLISKRLTNQIIPSRNVMLATIGAMFTGRVWINALAGEENGKEHDKSKRFFDDTSTLLSFTNEFFQNKTIIESPFSDMTKSDTIFWALQHGIPKEILLATSSCYHGSEVKCGKCLTCYKRYTAFLLNGIDEQGYNVNPLETDYAKEMKEEIPKAHKAGDYSRFSHARMRDHFRLIQILYGKNI